MGMINKASIIHGITVTLYEADDTKTEYDPFHNPIEVYEEIEVENVLVRPTTYEEQANDFNFYGKKLEYELCIPKSDNHEWENKKVSFFGRTFQVITPASQTIDAMTPLEWNRHYKVANYEQS